MSEEPNRKIDDLLKAYAKKRQDDAGQSEMHPATRKLLQDEVRRTFGRKELPAQRHNPWIFLKFAIGAAACLLVIAVVVITQRKPEGEFEVAKVAEPQAAVSSDNTARSVEAITPMERTLSDEGAHFEGDVSLQAGRAQAPAAVPAAPSADLHIEERAAPALAKRELAAKQLAKDQSAIAGGALPAPPVTTALKTLHFVTPTSQRAVAGAASATSSSQPLSNFRFEQTGDRVRIVDADGSVYEGKLLVAAVDSVRQTRTASRKADAEGAAAAADRPQQISQPLRFEVTGTNRVLQQPIRFEGTLSSTPVVPSTDAAVETKTKEISPSGQLGSLPSQTVNGTLLIGRTNAVQINAIQAQP